MSTSKFIGAKLFELRTLNESSRAEEGLTGGVNLALSSKGSTEVRWETSDKKQILTIVPKLKVEFKDEVASVVHITYESKHEVRFEVFGYTGFDPLKDLPDEAISPYLEMALWIVRSRATNSIRMLGIPSFVWPKSAELVPKDAEKIGAKARRAVARPAKKSIQK
jgi:hypothetical protein